MAITDRDYYPLTYVQQGLWFSEKTYPDTTFGNVVFSFQIKGSVSIPTLQQAIHILLIKNEGLRLRVIENEGNVLQYVSEFQSKEFEVVQFSDEAEKEKWIQERSSKGFHLLDTDLYDFVIWQCAGNTGFYMNCHHIICDAWAARLLSQQVKEYYEVIHEGLDIPEDEKPSYLRFVEDEQKYLSSKMIVKHKQYWIEKFHTLPQSCAMKAVSGHKNSNIQSNRHAFYFSKALTMKIKSFCLDKDISSFNFLFTIVQLVVYKFTSRKDLVVGTLTHNRSRKSEKDTIGMFVNTIPFRTEINPQNKFIEFSHQVGSELKSVFRHQKYPFQLLLEELRREYNFSGELIDLVFSFDTLTHSLKNKWFANGFEAFPIVIHGTERESADQWKFEIDYQVERYSEQDILKIKSAFLTLIDQVLENPDLAIQHYHIIDEEEYQLLDRFNHTRSKYPDDSHLITLFQEQVSKTPDQCSIQSGDLSLTYMELDQKSNHLAMLLKQKGLYKEEIIPVIMSCSEKYVITILGILKAGGAYLPLHPEWPVERIKAILEDVSAKIIITDRTTDLSFDAEYLNIHDCLSNNFKSEFDTQALQANSLAYVMYTSGTTGIPKGVMVEHRSIIRLVKNTNFFDYPANGKMLMTGAIHFDANTLEIWGSLLNGMELHIAPGKKILDASFLKAYSREYNIDILWLTTALFHQLAKHDSELFETIKTLMVGGEVISVNLVNHVKKLFPELNIIHAYGPTENTTFSTTYEVPNHVDGNLSIGKPIANSTVYVLNKDQNMLPVGFAGEIYVGGDGLARGYLNDISLTNDKFVPNPFKAGTKLYRTGDQGRWDEDGNLHFMGRMDNQIKIRGFRIELDEIKAHLLKYPALKDAIVIPEKSEGRVIALHAFVTVTNDVQPSEIREFLSKSIPDYMIPASITILDIMPLKTNGKIDTNILLQLKDVTSEKKDCIAPQNDIQALLVQIWKDVLNKECIGITDQFFHMGGDSIKAIQISYALQKEGFGMSMSDFYKNPTIETFSPCLKKISRPVKQGTVSGQAPLSPVQRWFFEQKFETWQVWNHCVLLKSQDGFDAKIVEDVFKKIIKHHDGLRTNYEFKDDHIVQTVQPLKADMCQCHFIDLKPFKDAVREIERFIEQVQTDFSCHKEPLIRIHLFETVQEDYLFITVHHLNIDGISWRILLQDFVDCYQAILAKRDFKFPLKTNAYLDWAKTINSDDFYKHVSKERTYWQKVVCQPATALPKDRESSVRPVHSRKTESISLSHDETKLLLEDVHQAYNTEMNDILLSSLTKTLFEWRQIRNIHIDLEGHGREPLNEEIDVSRTTGWFTSIFPFYLEFDPDIDIGKQIIKTKETLRHVPNKGCGYGVLKFIHDAFKSSMIPEISFNYLGQMSTRLSDQIPDITFESLNLSAHLDSNMVHPIEINSVVWGGKLKIQFEYNQLEFDAESIRMLAESYFLNLKEIIQYCSNRKNTEYTPGDFNDDSLSFDDLENINQILENLE